MENLHDLLSGSNFIEPPEVKALKEYVLNQHDSPCSVAITPHAFIVSVASAPLASNLQLEKEQITKICNLDKPLRIRVGA